MSIRKTRPADVPFDGVILTEKEALDVQRKLQQTKAAQMLLWLESVLLKKKL